MFLAIGGTYMNPNLKITVKGPSHITVSIVYLLVRHMAQLVFVLQVMQAPALRLLSNVSLHAGGFGPCLGFVRSSD